MKCTICGSEFEGRAGTKFCSGKCRKVASRGKTSVTLSVTKPVTDNVTDKLSVTNYVPKEGAGITAQERLIEWQEDFTKEELVRDAADYCRRTGKKHVDLTKEDLNSMYPDLWEQFPFVPNIVGFAKD